MTHLFILGDIEMGAGNISDDFISDKALARVIKIAGSAPGQVHLILNGDTFDFIKVPSKADNWRITEAVSLDKIKRIHAAHKQVFDALREFTKKEGKVIHFIFGNHDHDLVFPEVQEYLKKHLGAVRFPGSSLNIGGVYIEHGHRHDLVNFAAHPFHTYKGERVLSVPFGSAMVMGTFTDVKAEHPFLERIHDHKMMFRLYPPLLRKLTKRSLMHFFTAVKHMVTDREHPITNIPVGFAKEMYRRWKESDYGVPDASEHLSFLDLPRLCVIGHKHTTKVKKGNTTVVLPDTWRDEYSFVSKGKIAPKRKHYVHVKMDGDKLAWKLVHVPIKRSVWKFSDVLKDERKYIALAAKEEGFKSRI